MKTILKACLLPLILVGCATSRVVQTALHGDLAALQREIRESQKAGRLDRAALQELAIAVAGRELLSSPKPQAEERIFDLRRCAAPLKEVLQARAEQHDDGGAAAMLILVDLGFEDPDELFTRHARDESGAWRAVGARCSFVTGAGRARRELFLDPDQRVRRAAIRAAQIAADPADVDPLLEVARLDPDPLSRSNAARAAGAMRGRQVVWRLKDRWVRAPQSVRTAIVDAWSTQPTFASGGEHELVWAAETNQGEPGVLAALALVRLHSAQQQLGLAVLARAIASGTESERRLAIQSAPMTDRTIFQKVKAAAKDDNAEVAVVALARLVQNGDRRAAVIDPLLKLAKRRGAVGTQARDALAVAGENRIHSTLVLELAEKSAQRRGLAALGLYALGDYARAATALGDDDPTVRASVACSLIAER
ncbi:MAG TPA: HEAT repeat domain-containing protein [Polyangiaceae bacterium]